MTLARTCLLALALSFPLLAQTPEPELPEAPGIYAIIDTSAGRMVASLFDDLAPATVRNFIDLATGAKETKDKKGKPVRRPYFDGLIFHRVIKGFMIQTGDVKGTGAGDCGIPNLPDEFTNKLTFDNPGTLGMANTGRPNSGSCQFFITVGRASRLDGKHTIFGQVVAGQEVAVAISQVPTDPSDRPRSPVIIKSITIKTRQ